MCVFNLVCSNTSLRCRVSVIRKGFVSTKVIQNPASEIVLFDPSFEVEYFSKSVINLVWFLKILPPVLCRRPFCLSPITSVVATTTTVLSSRCILYILTKHYL